MKTKSWNTTENAIQIAKMIREMWGTDPLRPIDSRTPIKKIKDFLRNYMKK